MSKTIYISLPMKGRTDESIKARAKELTDLALKICPDASVATPLHMRNFYGIPADVELTYEEWLAIDVGFILAHADAVLFASDWQGSKGCQLENATAYIFGKEIINEGDLP